LTETAFLAVPSDSLFAKYQLLIAPCAFVGFQGCYGLTSRGQVNKTPSSVGFYTSEYRSIASFQLQNLKEVDSFIDALFCSGTRAELDASKAKLLHIIEDLKAITADIHP
jgi:hypothetical protein